MRDDRKLNQGRTGHVMQMILLALIVIAAGAGLRNLPIGGTLRPETNTRALRFMLTEPFGQFLEIIDIHAGSQLATVNVVHGEYMIFAKNDWVAQIQTVQS